MRRDAYHNKGLSRTVRFLHHIIDLLIFHKKANNKQYFFYLLSSLILMSWFITQSRFSSILFSIHLSFTLIDRVKFSSCFYLPFCLYAFFSSGCFLKMYLFIEREREDNQVKGLKEREKKRKKQIPQAEQGACCGV